MRYRSVMSSLLQEYGEVKITCHSSDILFYSFSLTLECADEDGMRYRSVMSSLLQEYGGVGIFVKAMH